MAHVRRQLRSVSFSSSSSAAGIIFCFPHWPDGYPGIHNHNHSLQSSSPCGEIFKTLHRVFFISDFFLSHSLSFSFNTRLAELPLACRLAGPFVFISPPFHALEGEKRGGGGEEVKGGKVSWGDLLLPYSMFIITAAVHRGNLAGGIKVSFTATSTI